MSVCVCVFKIYTGESNVLQYFGSTNRCLFL